MSLDIILRSLAIALIAAVISWAPFAVVRLLLTIPPGFSMSDPGGLLFALALIGSFGIGLPVALLVLWLAGKQIAQNPQILAMIVALSAIMLMLASFAVGGEIAMFTLGLPSALAALTYGILGWFWILRPLRNTLNNPPQEKEIA